MPYHFLPAMFNSGLNHIAYHQYGRDLEIQTQRASLCRRGVADGIRSSHAACMAWTMETPALAGLGSWQPPSLT